MVKVTADAGPQAPLHTPRLVVFAGLFLLSGTGGLTLQVLWMYRLGLVFGNAAYATAATLSAFFLGLALGGWFWGRRATRIARPLRAYGLLELGIAATALLCLPGLGFYEANYSWVTGLVGGHRGALIAFKFVFSVLLLLLPTALMGGTFPVLAQYAVPDGRELGKRGALLYAANTLGAAAGALLAGFYLLPALGVGRSYFVAVTLLAAVGVVSLVLDATQGGQRVRPQEPSPGSTQAPGSATIGRTFAVVAVASGFLTLAVEVLWTRMFAQVLQNSVYSFSMILVMFLVALGIGGLLAHLLARMSWTSPVVLVGLLSLGGLMVGLSPTVFRWVTGELAYIAPRATWASYVATVARTVAVVVLPPAILIGTVFPFLLKAIAGAGRAPGPLVGRLVLLNSLGAVAGPIVAGYVLLNFFGLWLALKILALAFGALALFVWMSQTRERGSLTGGGLAVAGLLGVLALPSPPIVRLEPGEVLRDVWQASDGVVSVVERAGVVQMRLDNFYALGDSRSILVEQMQAHIPLLIHPQPSSALFLGLGTGLTAGASLSHDVEQVVAVELVPNVIRAARRYFSPLVNGLFVDPRVEIVADDARNFLLGATQQYDVIVGDLFTPWHAGTGSLYTVEHFQLVREHLAEDGLFAQWLPLYQLTPEGFETIAATFASVFPQVTVWRADFSSSRAVIALVGQEAGARLDDATLARNSRNVTGAAAASSDDETDHMATLFYVGNLTPDGRRPSDIALNTDDRRVVEFGTPILSQEASAGRRPYVAGADLRRLINTIRAAVPAADDAYLSALPASEIRYADAGMLYFEVLGFREEGREAEAAAVMERLRSLVPAFAEGVANSGG